MKIKELGKKNGQFFKGKEKNLLGGLAMAKGWNVCQESLISP